MKIYIYRQSEPFKSGDLICEIYEKDFDKIMKELEELELLKKPMQLCKTKTEYYVRIFEI